MSKGFASNYRMTLLAAAICACFAGVGVRLFFLHVIDRDVLVKFVDRARRQIIVEHARRGDILDARGHILATSRSQVVLGVDPQSLRREDEAKWPQLAALIGMPLPELQRILTTKTRTVTAPAGPGGSPVANGFPLFQFAVAPAPDFPGPARAPAAAAAVDDTETEDLGNEAGERKIRWAKLSENIEESTYEKITALGIKGVYGNRVYRRTYPHNALAAHVIGYVNRDDQPSSGIEAYADFYLRGQNGWREGERDGLRRELAQFRTREVTPTHGYHVMLSVDAVIQHMVDEELAAIARRFNPDKATIIVSDAQTGFILGLGNYPTFNLNDYSQAPLDAQRNVAVTDQLDPGSTFKIVAAAGALNEGLVTPTTSLDCSITSIEYQGKVRRFMPDDHAFDHPLTVSEIISHSSNVGAARLGMMLGDERLYGYARAFGFGQRTGFPFGGEINGLLHPPGKWSGVDITRIPAGYSVSATPIQIHCAMAAIASGGHLLRPQIIRQIRDASGEVVYRFGGVDQNRVITRKTAQAMARMLQGVVRKNEGTAPEAAIPGYEVAGKTGTSQKLIDGRYSAKNHIGSFVGFFPASRPQVVITVIVDNGRPPGGGNAYGRVVAAPSFKHLAEQLIPYLDIKPVYETGRNLLALEGGRK